MVPGMTSPNLPQRRRGRWPYLVAIAAMSAVVVAGGAFLLRGVDKPAPATPTGAAPVGAVPVEPPSAMAAPFQPGSLYTFSGGAMTTTVLRYKQPAGDPSGAIGAGVLKAGETYGAIEVKTCLLRGKPEEVSVAPWSLEWADGTVAADKWFGVASPEYPYELRTLNPGKCVRGWISFTVPAKAKPGAAVYEGEANKGNPAEWKLS